MTCKTKAKDMNVRPNDQLTTGNFYLEQTISGLQIHRILFQVHSFKENKWSLLRFIGPMQHHEQLPRLRTRTPSPKPRPRPGTWNSKPRPRTWNTRQGQGRLTPRLFVAKAMASRIPSLDDDDDDDSDVCRSRSTKHRLCRAVEVWRSSHQAVDC